MFLAYSGLPPCPDPNLYVAVKTKEGVFWRRKRGTLKPAILNSALKKNAAALSVCSPVAKRIETVLEPYIKQVRMGRLHARMTSLLMKHYKQTGDVSLMALKEFDVQPDQYANNQWQSIPQSKQTGKKILMTLNPFEGVVKALNNLVTDYYFDAILLFGDAGKEHGLTVEVQTSPRYTFTMKQPPSCSFRFTLLNPGTPFLLFLKLSSIEGNEMAHHARHYGMKVMLYG
jgi:hypothetical protein